MERLAKASIRDTRAHNQRLALATIYNDGPVSRAGVARVTGLTRTTVSALVADLMDDGLVREIGRGPSTGGKAPILLQVDEHSDEHSFGAVSSSNLVAVKVSLGIGAGLVLNGSLFQGDGYGAGEIGHSVVVPGSVVVAGRAVV